MNITKNFTFAEFEASDKARALDITNVITSFDVRDAIVALCRNVLQPLRDAWKKPLHINSGYRSPALNQAVGGVPASQHTKGEAADVRTSDPLALAQLAYDLDLPFDQLILYPTFVHISHKADGRQRHNVLYDESYTGERLKL